MTSANMIGVSNGTTSSRGVRAVSWKRRRARVASGPNGRVRAGRGAGGAVSRLVTASPFGSAGRGERIAGQPQVDVIESRFARADRGDESELVDGRDRLLRALILQRHRQARADDEGILACDSSTAER